MSPRAGLPGASCAVPILVLAAGAVVPHAVAFPWGHILLSPGSEGTWEHPLWVRVVRGVVVSVCLSVRLPGTGATGLLRLGVRSGRRLSRRRGRAGRLCGTGLSRTAAACSGQHRPWGGGLGAPCPRRGAVFCGESPCSGAHQDIFTRVSGCHCSIWLAGGVWEIAAGVSFGSVAEEGVPAPSPGVIFGAVAAAICQPCPKAPAPLRVWHAVPAAGCRPSRRLAGSVALPGASCSAMGEPLGAGCPLPKASIPVQPMPASHQRLCAAAMQCQRPWGSGRPPGRRCLGCLVARGQAELPSASYAPAEFGGLVLVLVFQPPAGVFSSQGPPGAGSGEEPRETPLPTPLLN